ncbi:MAG: RDD family protein, partial [Solirubrobacteraceae bacterium]|nr:RDD family protein [Solirubrobacteraceae bacterium]
MSVTFTTPQAARQPALAAGEVQIASLRRRSLALLLDSCVLMLIGTMLLAPVWLLAGGGPESTDGIFHRVSNESSANDLLWAAGEYLVFPFVWLLYAGLLTSRTGAWNGQTLGKRAAQLKIIQADGSALTARAAWRRALWSTAVLSLVMPLGRVIDAAAGTAPTASEATMWINGILAAGVVLWTLRGEQRRTAYDLLARTVVIDVPERATPAGAVVSAPEATPTFAQVPSEAPATVVPRARVAGTWIGVGLAALLMLTTPLLDRLELPEDRSKEILALPETKDALQRARTLEALVTACLSAGRSAEACDEATELRAPEDLEFVEVFDLEADGVGAHAGKVALVADGDDAVIVYAFTSADRVWSSIVEQDDTDHVCVNAAGD